MGSDHICALVVFHESRETLKPVARHSGMVLYSSLGEASEINPEESPAYLFGGKQYETLM